MRTERITQYPTMIRQNNIIKLFAGEDKTAKQLFEIWVKSGLGKMSLDIMRDTMSKMHSMVHVARWNTIRTTRGSAQEAVYRAGAGVDMPRPKRSPAEKLIYNSERNRLRRVGILDDDMIDLPIRRSGAEVQIRPYGDLPISMFNPPRSSDPLPQIARPEYAPVNPIDAFPSNPFKSVSRFMQIGA
jgi:hypothetical protein